MDNQVAYKCAECDYRFKAGDPLFYNKNNEHICENCAKGSGQAECQKNGRISVS